MMHERDQRKSDYGADAGVFCAKGISRRVVVVSAADHPIYEQVIYVVKDEAARRGVTAQEVLREAQRCLPTMQEDKPVEALVPESDEDAPERVSRMLFALSGAALALSSGILVYWFFAM